MGKTTSEESHKGDSNKTGINSKNSGTFNSQNFVYDCEGTKRVGSNLFHSHSDVKDRDYVGTFTKGGNLKKGKNTESDKNSDNDKGNDVNDKGSSDHSIEVWCICRVVKPCRHCHGQREEDRDVTPTPENTRTDPGDSDLESKTTATHSEENLDSKSGVDITKDDAEVGQKNVSESYSCSAKDSNNVDKIDFVVNDDFKQSSKKCSNKANENSSGSNISKDLKFECKTIKSEVDKDLDRVSESGVLVKEVSELSEAAVGNLQELLNKLEDIHHREKHSGDADSDIDMSAVREVNGYSGPATPTPSTIDNASLCSSLRSTLDPMDFDASFCSLKSSDMMMEQGDLSEQLSLVQQMVVEMKTGFSNAMEELSKIQYGDQSLQEQLADNRKYCNTEIDGVKQVVHGLKSEVQSLCSRIQEVSDVQRSLQEKLDSYQSDKDMLLDELEQSGAINDQIRMRLSGGTLREDNNNIPNDVAPMVHPYLNSLQNHNQRGPEDNYNSDSSLTAAVSRSLNLTQALGEKCLHLDVSTTSSDDEDNSRHSHSGSGHKSVQRHGSFQFDDGRTGQKVPPHEQMMEEVQREEAARDMVEAEREYCGHIWSLLEDYINPLRAEEVISDRELNLLFPTYIPHIYEQHCIILRKLEERMKKWKFNGVVGDVFAKFTDAQEGDGLALYKDFINDFPAIIGAMNKWFTHSPLFREMMQSQCLANSPVLPLLLAPLQQVPKYSLLLKNLLKFTPMEHPDRYYLESSLNRLKLFLNNMNDDLEHAMQVINSQPMNRSRESGHSGRSRSSGSSGEVTGQRSRDSGVHSNEEERAKSPMSPNTTRRFLLQVLREKREHGSLPNHSKVEGQGRSQGSRGRKLPGFGSHPDLSNQVQGIQNGRMSPYLSSLPQSKMFSSLSKLPLPRENSRKSRSNKQNQDAHSQRPPINTNYLRPLTPQVLPTSTSAHSFESARRREELAERARHRPQSAIEFGYDGQDRHEQYLEMLAHQASLKISPPHSTASDRSRRDMQLSLQKLLVETNNSAADYNSDNDNDQEVNETEPQRSSYHRQFLATKDKILKHSSDNNPNVQNSRNVKNYHSDIQRKRNSEPLPVQEDYGVYGDDDEDDDEGYEQEVKPMKLLPEKHRPKIMVPRWRQNASPQPPSYNHTVEYMNKGKNDFTSEENLAASLAQSLLEGNATNNQTPTKEFQEQENSSQVSKQTAKNTKTGSLKWKDLQRKTTTESPKNSNSPRSEKIDTQSPETTIDSPNNMTNDKNLSVETSPRRPTDLNLSGDNTSSHSPANLSKPITKTNSDSSISSHGRLHSVTKLNDVIAYTADCLEKKDSTAVSSHSNTDTFNQEMSGKTQPELSNGKPSLSKVLADTNLKVSSVDNYVGSETKKTSADASLSGTASFTFATMPKYNASESSMESVSPVNTDSIVHYFQNRSSFNQGKLPSAADSIESPNRPPTFIPMNKTSTPITEHQYLISSQSPAEVSLPNVAKKQSGRFIRGDEQRLEPPKKTSTDGDTTDSSDKSNEGPTKESVLRAVDKLRMSFEKQKQISEERRQSQSLTQPISPTRTDSNFTSALIKPRGIRQKFNELSSPLKSPDSLSAKPLVLKSFASPQRQTSENSDTSNSSFEQSEPKSSHYRKAGQLKTPTKYPSEASASARQIQKLERSVSPVGVRSNTTTDYEKFKSQVESSNTSRPTKRRLSSQGATKDGSASFIPQRSKSPTRERRSMERERPKSTTELTKLKQLESMNGHTDEDDIVNPPLKSALKDTKIPVLRKPGGNHLSQSSEDVSKMKKKSAFKDQLKSIFGRKKKKSKLFNNGYDPDEEYNNHVTIVAETSFQHMDDFLTFPLTRERRSNSTSQILQSYTFESDEDSDEVSAV